MEMISLTRGNRLLHSVFAYCILPTAYCLLPTFLVPFHFFALPEGDKQRLQFAGAGRTLDYRYVFSAQLQRGESFVGLVKRRFGLRFSAAQLVSRFHSPAVCVEKLARVGFGIPRSELRYEQRPGL